MSKIFCSLLVLLGISLAFAIGSSFAKNNQGASALNSPNTWDSFMASGTVGRQLRDQSGNYVAEMMDFVIDPATGRVSHVILSQIQGMEAKTIAVPFSTISETAGGEILVYHRAEVAEKYYGQAPYWSEGFYFYANQSMPMGSYEASKLIGSMVSTSKGEYLRQIKDLEIYALDGSVYAIFLLNVDGKKETARVPLSWMHQTGNNTFVLNVAE